MWVGEGLHGAQGSSLHLLPKVTLKASGRVSSLLFQVSLGSGRHGRFSKIKSWYQHLRVFLLGVWLEEGKSTWNAHGRKGAMTREDRAL